MQKSRKKNRRHGRNSSWCAAYKMTGRREINKARKLLRHLARFTNDRCAVHCYNNLPILARPATNRANFA